MSLKPTVTMIKVEGLTKKFGALLAVDNVSFEIKEGEVFGFLGPNGAGKTTTIRMITTLISKTGGKVSVGGLDTDEPKNRPRIRKMIGLLPENPGLYDKLSVYRNLEFFADLYGVSPADKKERIERYLKMLGLWERRNDTVGGFSKGMRQKIALIRAVLHDPKYLFLDEPTSGLDPEASRTVRDLILELKKKDRIIFLNTHNLDEASRICDRVGIINQKLLAVDSPDRLESRLYGSGTEIELQSVTGMKSVAERVKGVRKAIAKDNKLLLDCDPGAVPDVVRALVKNGAEIMSVEQTKHSLEDVYFKLLKKEDK